MRMSYLFLTVRRYLPDERLPSGHNVDSSIGRLVDQEEPMDASTG